MSQSFLIGGHWTERRHGVTLEEWFLEVPGGDPAPGPGGCDHYTPWQSGGQTAAICTKCAGDESAGACLARHQEAVEFFKTKYPEDP